MGNWTRAVPVVAALLAGTAAHGAATNAALQVSARVPRHATIRMAQPLSLTVSAADVDRGYVDVDSPVELTVQSNVHEGYTLSFACRCDEVRQVHVRGLASDLSVGGAPVMTARPAAGPGVWRDKLQLRVRVDLAPGMLPGEHAWPLRISMMSQ